MKNSNLQESKSDSATSILILNCLEYQNTSSIKCSKCNSGFVLD